MDSNVSAGEIPKPSIGLFNHFFITRLEDTPAPPDKAVAPSRAEHHILLYVTEGAVHVTIGERRYIAQEEEMIVIAAAQIWSWDGCAREEFNRGFLIRFKEDWLVGCFGPGAQAEADKFEFLDPIGNPRIRFAGMDAKLTEAKLESLHFEVNSRWIRHSQRFIPQDLVYLLTVMARHYRPLFFRAPQKGHQLTHRFRLLLHQHYLTKQRVSEYAELLDITPNHLNKVVRETTCRSPTQWIDEAIVAEAKLLLVSTSLPVAEVAAKAGIEDPSYFIRMFGKYVGMTPGGYRALWKGK